jgi:hypothetical protein
MAVAFVSGSANSGTGTSVIVNAPAGIVAGNLLVAVVYCGVSTTSPGFSSAGWGTQMSNPNANTAGGWGVLTKLATTSEPSTYTINGPGKLSAAILQFSGAAAALDGSIATNFVASNQTACTAPSATPSVTGDIVLAVFGSFTGSSFTTPSGMSAGPSATSSSSIYSFYNTLATTSPTGTISSTQGTATTYGGLSLLTTPIAPGAYFWLDASQIIGVANGAILANWPDLSGNAVNFTSGSGPTYYKTTTANLINNLPTVSFAARSMSYTNHTMVFPDIVQVVVKPASTASGGIVSNGTGRPDFAINATQWVVSSVSSGGISGGIAGGTVDTNPHVVTFNTGPSGYVRVDGVVVASTGSMSATPILADIAVGVGHANYSGLIGEIIYYDAATLTLAQVAANEAYLQAKWGTPALPGVNGIASLALGPLTLTSTGTNIATGVATVALGPLAVSATGTVLALATGTAALPLGPLTLASLTSDLISIGPLTLAATATVVIPAPPYVRITVADRLAVAVTSGDR